MCWLVDVANLSKPIDTVTVVERVRFQFVICSWGNCFWSDVWIFSFWRDKLWSTMCRTYFTDWRSLLARDFIDDIKSKLFVTSEMRMFCTPLDLTLCDNFIAKNTPTWGLHNIASFLMKVCNLFLQCIPSHFENWSVGKLPIQCNINLDWLINLTSDKTIHSITRHQYQKRQNQFNVLLFKHDLTQRLQLM